MVNVLLAENAFVARKMKIFEKNVLQSFDDTLQTQSFVIFYLCATGLFYVTELSTDSTALMFHACMIFPFSLNDGIVSKCISLR